MSDQQDEYLHATRARSRKPSNGSIADAAALLLGGVAFALFRLGRWLMRDDDHLADFGGDD